MDKDMKNLLITQIKKAQQDAASAALWMQDDIANFHYKRGYLAALQASLQLKENNLEKHVENQN